MLLILFVRRHLVPDSDVCSENSIPSIITRNSSRSPTVAGTLASTVEGVVSLGPRQHHPVTTATDYAAGGGGTVSSSLRRPSTPRISCRDHPWSATSGCMLSCTRVAWRHPVPRNAWCLVHCLQPGSKSLWTAECYKQLWSDYRRLPSDPHVQSSLYCRSFPSAWWISRWHLDEM